jgi:hypothetical protein
MFIDYAAGARGVEHVDVDAANWLHAIAGEGHIVPLPTPKGEVAFALQRGGKPLAVVWYIADGHGGWLREHYRACSSATET